MPEALNLPATLNNSVNSLNDSTDVQGETGHAAKIESNFSILVGRFTSEEISESGKQLPVEGLEMTDNDALDIDAEWHQKFSCPEIVTQSAGQINLVLGQGEVSDDSLLDFMNEQGFSRSTIASLLVQTSGGPSHGEGVSNTIQTTTDSWLRAKGIDTKFAKSSEEILNPLSVSEIKHATLTQGLISQLELTKSALKTSPISELITNKSYLNNVKNSQTDIMLAVEDVLDFADLLEIDLPKDFGDMGSSLSREHESSSLFSNANRWRTDGVFQKEQAGDFRQFVADHLRRAETLQQLTDRLGTFVARQVTAQLGKGSWSLDLTLHPSELGSIKVDMEMTERGLEATFRASHSVTRDLLMDSMPKLKEWFEEGGINVAYSGLSKDSDTGNENSEPNPESSSESEGAHQVGLEHDQDQEQIADGDTNAGRLDIRV